MRIMFVGDISLGDYYTSFGHGPASYLKHSNVFDKVQHIFDEADLVIGNLETALTHNNYIPDEPESVVLRGDPTNAVLLKKTGFDVLQVANNHTVQHGVDGFNETTDSLNSADIKAIGLRNQKVTILDVEGVKIGFFAASDVPDNTDKKQVSYQTLDDVFINNVKSAVQDVDHLFVMLHWGLEASTKPMDYQRALIKELSSAGVRGVIGSHPHLFYEIWKQDNLIAAPSLGNFVFDLCWDERLLKTGILDVEIKNNELNAQVWPIEITKNGCVPTPTGEPIKISPAATLYDLGKKMDGEERRKLKYFFLNIHKGHLALKTKFIMRKFYSSINSIFR